MSLYDKASLVLIPSGTKEGTIFSQKPTNGDGDFTFSRSTSATRVGPSGYIEKETQNLLLQSNSFDTSWAIDDVTLTSGQSGYDSSNDAWKLVGNTNASRHHIRQSISLGGVNTLSLYAKASGHNYVQFGSASSTNQYVNFDLSDGSIGNIGSDFFSAIVENIGSGWYRLSVVDKGSTNGFYISLVSSKTAGWLESWAMPNATDGILIQDAQLEAGLVATDYIETTTSAVYGGITDNVPRLDYTDSSCPALLLEPQRTNLVTQSELFEGFFALQGAAQIENDTTSPEGVQNAVKMYPTSTGAYKGYNKTFGSSLSNTAYTLSVYAKAAEFEHMFFYGIGAVGGTGGVWFNLSTGNVGTTGAAWSNAKMTDMGDGWYRCEATLTYGGSADYWYILAADIDGNATATASGTNGLYLYGAQMEEASYATSYIPTYGTSVTRNADACYKTGVSDLIGQTEGTLFAEVSVDTDSVSSFLNRVIVVTDGTLSNRVLIVLNTDETFRFIIIGGGSTLANITTSASVLNGFHKVALAYKANDYVAYVDGVEVGSNTSAASVPSSLSQAFLGSVETGAASRVLEGSVKQFLMFKTRLSNEELATLTTL